MALRVNEIFESIQGEGSHAGRACFFVRLQGCSVGCHFCDEKKTWRADQGTSLSPDEILARMRLLNPDLRYVTISGGEPCEQDLSELLDLFAREGYSVAIETSGTGDYAHVIANRHCKPATLRSLQAPAKQSLCDNETEIATAVSPPRDDTWITLSPKEIYSSKIIAESIWQAASEIKFVIVGAASAEYLSDVILPRAGSKPVYIVPDWFNYAPNRDLALELCRNSNGRVKLGVQMHKYLEIA